MEDHEKALSFSEEYSEGFQGRAGYIKISRTENTCLKNQLYIFPLHDCIRCMKVVEKDKAVHGLLREEYRRCQEVLAALSAQAAQYPKGSLNIRKKRYKGKEYAYHYLVAREGGRVVNRHISEAELPELQRQIELREKCRKEMREYKKRISYLEKLLRLPGREDKKDK